jgi:hypothetical protein
LETSVHNSTASIIMNNQNITVFRVELEFTAYLACRIFRRAAT